MGDLFEYDHRVVGGTDAEVSWVGRGSPWEGVRCFTASSKAAECSPGIRSIGLGRGVDDLSRR